MGAVLAVGLVRLYGPLSTIRGQSVRMAQLRATKAGFLAQQTDLEEYKRFLATETGQEAAARRMGYLRPGERRVVFVPAKDPQSKGSAKARPSAAAPHQPKPSEAKPRR
jgi:hypothetical protein